MVRQHHREKSRSCQGLSERSTQRRQLTKESPLSQALLNRNQFGNRHSLHILPQRSRGMRLANVFRVRAAAPGLLRGVRRFHDEAPVLSGAVPFEREAAQNNQQAMDALVQQLKNTVDEIKSPKSLAGARCALFFCVAPCSRGFGTGRSTWRATSCSRETASMRCWTRGVRFWSCRSWPGTSCTTRKRCRPEASSPASEPSKGGSAWWWPTTPRSRYGGVAKVCALC
jgi:hypothetical protein